MGSKHPREGRAPNTNMPSAKVLDAVDHTAGLLLCGGRSTRMGFHKASLRFKSGPLWQHMLGVLSQTSCWQVACCSAEFAQQIKGSGAQQIKGSGAQQIKGSGAQQIKGGDGGQTHNTKAQPSSVKVTWLPDAIPYQGPLVALCHGMQHVQQHATSRIDWIAVGAVDLPFLRAEVFWHLLCRAQSQPPNQGKQAGCVLQVKGRINPLISLISLQALPCIKALVANGERSAQAMVRHLQLEVLDAGTLSLALHTLEDVDEVNAYRLALLRQGLGAAKHPVLLVAWQGGEQGGIIPLHVADTGEGQALAITLLMDAALQLRQAVILQQSSWDTGARDARAWPRGFDQTLVDGLEFAQRRLRAAEVALLGEVLYLQFA